jgi:hypothetical protein
MKATRVIRELSLEEFDSLKSLKDITNDMPRKGK